MMIGVSPEHTSVPRWPATPGDVDPTGTQYVVVAAGRDGAEVAARWQADIERSGKPICSHCDESLASLPGETADPCVAALQAGLRGASVGVRIMLAGPELTVLVCARAAREAGALDCEMTMHVTDRARKRVYCPHCRTSTEAEVAVGARLTCDGCSRQLVVYHHVSRHRGAYLGFMADAEAAPA